MAIKCRIFWDESAQAYILTLTPDRRIKPFVELLKHAIPSGDRDYDPKTYMWYFKEVYADGVRALAQSVYGIHEVSFTSKTVVEQARRQAPVGLPTTPIKQAFVEFIALVNEDASQIISYEVAKRAYRKACVALHPDHGGDAIKMSQLNALWTRVEHEYYGK